MILSQLHKVDVGLVPQTINNTNVTGSYYPMAMWRRVLAILQVGAIAATKKVKVELLQASDGAGTGAKAITSASAEITANTAVTAATLTCASVLATQAVTINDLTFTAAAAADLPNRVFAVGASDTECAASLVLAINHATAGVPGISATSALGVVTLTASPVGEETITIKDPAATITPATTQAQAYVELDVAQLDDGFDYIAAKVTSTANGICGVTLVRSEGRFGPDQAVGASAVV